MATVGIGKSLSERVRRLSERALQKVLESSRTAPHKWLSHALKGSAGAAHRWCAKEDALSDLPLVIRDRQGAFTADPQCVAKHCAHKWKRDVAVMILALLTRYYEGIRASREARVGESGDWANGLDLSAENIRKAYLSFPSKTAIGLNQHSFQDIARVPDKALVSLREIVGQCFAKFATLSRSLFS